MARLADVGSLAFWSGNGRGKALEAGWRHQRVWKVANKAALAQQTKLCSPILISLRISA
jgi:hypothetical protein